MTRMRAMVLGVGLLLAIPTMAAVINVDVNGDWTLTVDDPTHGCEWVGPLAVVQTGSTFTGSATLKLQPGSSDPCPSSLTGTVSGTLVGLAIKFGIAIGVDTASLDGTVANDQSTASGTWMIPGEFDGTWHAERIVGVHAPAMNAAGLIGLLLLLLAGGVYVLRRRTA
jgi:hypothetical protein